MRVFVNDKAVDVPRGARVRDAVAQADDGLARLLDGAAYVTDAAGRPIRELSPTGVPLAQWGTDDRAAGQFNQPSGLAIDAEGTIYVADTENHRIQKLSPTGASLAQ